MSHPQVIRDPGEMQRHMAKLRRQGKTIAIVPTMGALHDGHRTLIAEGRRRGDFLIVSLFLNPAQFAPHEDLDRYPRTFEADEKMCAEEAVDFIFFPTPDAMYPPGYSTYVHVEGLTGELCGRSRPKFFRGVATVVTKLFLITQPDVAVFGWKDAQQLLVVRRMAEDLNIPVRIVGVETVREPDGLAMSSRNKYLTPDERTEAVVLSKALAFAKHQVESEGVEDAAEIRRRIRLEIENHSKGRIDYIEIVDMKTIKPIERIERGRTLIALAVFFGDTRLIDNFRI